MFAVVGLCAGSFGNKSYNRVSCTRKSVTVGFHLRRNETFEGLSTVSKNSRQSSEGIKRESVLLKHVPARLVSQSTNPGDGRRLSCSLVSEATHRYQRTYIYKFILCDLGILETNTLSHLLWHGRFASCHRTLRMCTCSLLQARARRKYVPLMAGPDQLKVSYSQLAFGSCSAVAVGVD